MTTAIQTDNLNPLCKVVANECCSKFGIQFLPDLQLDIGTYLATEANEDDDPNALILALSLMHDKPAELIAAHLHSVIVYDEFVAWAKQFFDLELMDYTQACTALNAFKNKRPTLFEAAQN